MQCAVALMARDRALPLPCFQMLVYPMTDRRMITSSVARFSDTPMWNSALNRRSWELYLQDQPLVDGHAADVDAATSASAACSASASASTSGAASAACSAPAGSTASARTASSAPAYASPAEAYDLKGLPDAYVETAEFDCLHDEGAAYARRLAIDGAQVELNQTEGTVHGFDMVMGSPLVQTCIARRVDALRRAFVRQMTLRVASEWDLDESLRG